MSSFLGGRGEADAEVHAKSLLERELYQFVVQVGTSNDDRLAHSMLIRQIAAVAQTVLSASAQILVYGSAASGLCERLSDIDATVKVDFPTLSERFYGVRSIPAASETRALCAESVQAIANFIYEHPEYGFSVKQLIPGAKVPIVVLMAAGGQTVDISINNELPIHNTRLLRAYATLDDRVRILVLSVKRWARLVGVSDAKLANLSSYSWTLMCVYYLQVRDKSSGGALLPSLQRLAQSSALETGLFRCPCTGRVYDCRFQAVVDGRYRLSCSSSSVELLTDFFAFYASEFRWGEEVVSIRQGRRLSIHENVFSTLSRGKLFDLGVATIHIEDPLDIQRNLNCVLDIEGLSRLTKALSDVHSRIANVPYSVLINHARLLFLGTPPKPGHLGPPPGITTCLEPTQEDQVSPTKPVIPLSKQVQLQVSQHALTSRKETAEKVEFIGPLGTYIQHTLDADGNPDLGSAIRVDLW